MRSAQRYLRQVAALLALTTNVGQAFLSLQHSPSFATRRSVDLHSTEKEATDGESQLSILKGVNATASALTTPTPKRKMDLVWCTNEYCKDVVRERVVGDHNQIILNGPATGQVAYNWNGKPALKEERQYPTTCAVLLLVKPNDEELMQVAAKAVQELTALDIEVLLVPDLAAKLNHYYGVNDNRISLFEPEDFANLGERHANSEEGEWSDDTLSDGFTPYPDLVCTLGGDGLLMYASMMFQGPVPPIISIAGGSLGFLTPFSKDEMVDAVRIALGLVNKDGPDGGAASSSGGLDAFSPNMPSFPSEPLVKAPHALDSAPKFSFGFGSSICLTIRMRLECSIISREGVVKAKYNVLNEVVIDRGSSPYLAALECFCDDVHLTTVQADGVIFATPTGSTAYSMAAGGSVVHPAVPSILVTPICPHVLSFRSMVFPDHVVLRCYVPEDARTHASVAFDGKYRQELQRGDSVQVQMSTYPVPTINRGDHSSDWLESLKRSFNFNTRPRQRPL